MKFSILNKVFWGSAIAISAVTLPFIPPATAQTDAVPGDNTGIVEDDNDDDGFDWGWLGLLGLIGLAGLTRKPEDRDRYRNPADPATVSRSDYTNPR